MNIHEYQGKQLLSQYGVPVPRGHVAFTVEEAVKAAEELGGSVFVVKSQIHAGGRGAGRFEDDPDGKGGVRLHLRFTDPIHGNQRRVAACDVCRKRQKDLQCCWAGRW